MRKALAAWDWATVLTIVQRESGLNQLQIAQLTGFSQPHVSRLMNGQASCYDIRAIRSMIDGLGAPRVFAGLAPRSGAEEASLPLNTIEEVTPTLRRTVLTASLALPVVAILGTTHRAKRVTYPQAIKIRGLLPELYKLDDRSGGAAISDVAQWCLREVDALLNTADYDEAAGRELQLAFGELAEMTGWLDFDAGRGSTAQYRFGEALRAAQLADNLNLEVLVLASMNMLARHRGRPREAIQLVQLAQRRAAGWGTPRLLSLLSAREAVCWAQAGDSQSAQNAIHRALRLFQVDRTDDDPSWLEFFTAAELAAQQASVHSYLGRHGRAVEHLMISLDTLGSEFSRNRALYTARLALAHLGQGDERQACQLLGASVPLFKRVWSGRTTAHLGEAIDAVRTSTAPYARELIEQMTEANLVRTA
jgi:hypothetical protein